MLLDGDYPPVTHLLFRYSSEQLECLPWDAVVSIDWQARQIVLTDMATAMPSAKHSGSRKASALISAERAYFSRSSLR